MFLIVEFILSFFKETLPHFKTKHKRETSFFHKANKKNPGNKLKSMIDIEIFIDENVLGVINRKQLNDENSKRMSLFYPS